LGIQRLSGQIEQQEKMASNLRTISETALGLSPLTLIKAALQPRMVPVRMARHRAWCDGSLTGTTTDACQRSMVRSVRELVPSSTERDVRASLADLHMNHSFYEELNRKFVPLRNARAVCGGHCEFVYVVLRSLAPDVVVETGVWDGQCTSVALQALADNKRGRLISIDLPAREPIVGSTDGLGAGSLPEGCDPGWAIPDYLKDRHTLLLGDARDLLPTCLAEEESIDVFSHDSLHTYDHMKFEYETAWPFIRDGGLLMSHDIFDNPSFVEFAKKVDREFVHSVATFGALRK
jgi:methyltransferase family protein